MYRDEWNVRYLLKVNQQGGEVKDTRIVPKGYLKMFKSLNFDRTSQVHMKLVESWTRFCQYFLQLSQGR